MQCKSSWEEKQQISNNPEHVITQADSTMRNEMRRNKTKLNAAPRLSRNIECMYTETRCSFISLLGSTGYVTKRMIGFVFFGCSLYNHGGRFTQDLYRIRIRTLRTRFSRVSSCLSLSIGEKIKP